MGGQCGAGHHTIWTQQLTRVVVYLQKEDGERWHGEFSASYIEEVTQKTGNFKKFSVFVKMLATSLKRDQRSETVFADLLTYSDLEMLRSRQTRKPLNTAARPNNKRYLILTYAVEFDRVHYPLPLAHVDEPPAAALNGTIRRLREEIKQMHAQGYSQGAGVFTFAYTSAFTIVDSQQARSARILQMVTRK